MKFQWLGKTISGRFTIPSGVIATNAKTLERVAREIPQLGVLTTKSVGPRPREGHREPIFTQYAPGCFMNAVGLTNPGADEFARQLEQIALPPERFLLISIFGGTVDEFVQVAQRLAPYADGLELNLSCPNAQGYGMSMGQDAAIVHEVVKAVKQAVAVPVIPKLTPNAPDIGVIARAAADAGADAICAINTVGPGYFTVDGFPVLTNVYGGMSGKGILPLGLKCVKQIAAAVNVPIIGGGGISSAADVRAYADAGASIFSVGTALTGLSTPELQTYFAALERDFDEKTNAAPALLKTPDVSFTPCKLLENRRLAPDLSLLVFDRDLAILPGQFIFAWLPGVGEKPFSVLDDAPLTLSIQRRGCVTEKLCDLPAGATVYMRGPYGAPVTLPPRRKPVLVCGGCGMAAVYHIAKTAPGAELFIGARDAQRLFYLERARSVAEVHVSTEDGSAGQRGLVTDLLQARLRQGQFGENAAFFNCGPPRMIERTTEIEMAYAPPEFIYNSIDYVTKCGVGVCGSCAAPDGRRLCVDGPFFAADVSR